MDRPNARQFRSATDVTARARAPCFFHPLPPFSLNRSPLPLRRTRESFPFFSPSTSSSSRASSSASCSIPLVVHPRYCFPPACFSSAAPVRGFLPNPYTICHTTSPSPLLLAVLSRYPQRFVSRPPYDFPQLFPTQCASALSSSATNLLSRRR